MSEFLERLDHELASRRVRRSLRRRIALEYADHLACDPDAEARLGDPAELAGAFAAELAADDARRVARNAFMALALAALALTTGQLTIAPAGGYPGYNSGLSTALAVPAILTILIAPQIALVAGSLAALRALRTRSSRRLPDAEVALIRRRSAVAIGAGLATCAAMMLYATDHTHQMAGWWVALQLGLAVAAALALTMVAVQARRARHTIGAVPGPSGGIVDDVPPLALVVANPRAACVAAVLLAGTAGAVLGSVAERSAIEGLERGTFEAIVVGVCLAVTLRISAGAASRGRAPHC
ncbi:MAG TPA: hypothetical protein VFI54_02765 [Solirubrobacteraceae bacterium]|nr:hypothetical protein [Solirubrobacteraceae bacterium]